MALSNYRKTQELIRNGEWPPLIKGKIKLSNTGITPRIFELLKDHKIGFLFRPIVSRRQGPLYFVEKAFAIFLKSILPSSTFSVSSTLEFINRINDFILPSNAILPSFDIVSLFPSIDVEEVIISIGLSIDELPHLSDNMKFPIKSGLNLIKESNLFIFKDKYFNPLRGKQLRLCNAEFPPEI